MCKAPARALTLAPTPPAAPRTGPVTPRAQPVHTPCIRDGRTEGAGIMVKGAGGWGWGARLSMQQRVFQAAILHPDIQANFNACLALHRCRARLKLAPTSLY